MTTENQYDKLEAFIESIEAKVSSIIQNPRDTNPYSDLMLHKANFIVGDIAANVASYRDGEFQALFFNNFKVQLLTEELVMAFHNGTVCAILTIPRYPNREMLILSTSSTNIYKDKHTNEVSAAKAFFDIVKEGFGEE